MKRSMFVLILFAAAPLLAQQPLEIRFHSVPDFLKLPPDIYLGEATGVAVNSKGHVFVFTRSGETRLFEFDQNGNYVREIGQGLYGFEMAHGVRVDSQDNIWAVDEGTNMVIKFSPEGRVLMTMGRREEAVEGVRATPAPGTPPPSAQPYRFNRPTDVTWDPAGNIYISDGYGNSRVAKYDKNGRFIREVGTRGTQPGQMNTPHSITSDAKGNIYVADNVGAPWAVCISPGPHQYLYSSNSNPDNNDSRLMAVSGEVYKMELDGTIVGKFGKPGKQLGEFSTIHAIDCRNENELVVAEITAWRIQKLVLKPQRVQTSSRAK